MTLEWKEPNKSQLWWRDLVEREKREGCLICTIPFPLFPWAFSMGGTKQPWTVKTACLWLVLLKSQLCSWQWRIICTLFILPPTSFSTTRLSDCSPAGSQWCILPHLTHLIQLNRQLLSKSGVLEEISASPRPPFDTPSLEREVHVADTHTDNSGKLDAIVSYVRQAARRDEPVSLVKTQENPKNCSDADNNLNKSNQCCNLLSQYRGTVCG